MGLRSNGQQTEGFAVAEDQRESLRALRMALARARGGATAGHMARSQLRLYTPGDEYLSGSLLGGGDVVGITPHTSRAVQNHSSPTRAGAREPTAGRCRPARW